MAAGLARSALGPDIAIESAGLRPEAVDPLAVAAMAEVRIDLSRTLPVSVSDLDLETFEVIVSIGAPSLPLAPRQISRAWRMTEPQGPDLPAVRQLRDALSLRIGALSSILQAGGRA